MAVIDADAHVIETEQTWEFMEGTDRRFAPLLVLPKQGGIPCWRIDDRVFPISNVGSHFPKETRELSDVKARLAHMDELGIDIQVVYPTLFLRPVTNRADVELAIFRSYNRWMGHIASMAGGRIRYAALLPFMTMDKAVEELRWSKEHGACGAFFHPSEGDRLLSDPYFFPLYEEATRLDLPICIHAGSGSFGLYDYFAQDPLMRFQLPVVGAFNHVIRSGLPERFPKLRWGFVETTAQWLPYMLNIVLKQFRSDQETRKRDPSHPILAFAGGQSRELVGSEILKEYRLYVACQTTDDLPLVLQYAGEDHIMVGTDYGHADFSNDAEAMRKLARTGELSSGAVQKILSENPKRLYGL